MRTRVVLDASVLVAAIRSPLGASRALMDAALEPDFEILLTTALVLEYEAVLTRPEHLMVSSYSLIEVEKLPDAICATGSEVSVRFQWRPQLQDPDDELVLETAINGQADAIITFNLADYRGASAGFGVPVLSPSEALKRVRSL